MRKRRGKRKISNEAPAKRVYVDHVKKIREDQLAEGRRMVAREKAELKVKGVSPDVSIFDDVDGDLAEIEAITDAIEARKKRAK